MSRLSRSSRKTELLHERARLLASEAMDTRLDPADAAWLAAHLDACAECRAIAGEYVSLRDELRALAVPEPPRDLWARTSAALDEVDRSYPRARSRQRSGFGGWAANRSSLGAALAVGLVVVISGVSLLSQVPGDHGPASTRPGTIAFGSTPPLTAQAPVAVVDGTGYWITQDGQTYQLRTGSAKCSGSSDRCSVSSDSGTTIGSITSDSPVFAALAPDAKQAAVWNGNTVAILPLVSQTPPSVAIDQMTPRPTATESATASITEPTPTVGPTITASATSGRSPAASVESSTPSATASPSLAPSPSPSPSTAPTVAVPTAILNGYKVVGRAPEFSPDGQWVAFSAAPTNASTGPDLFVWQVGQERARAVTSAHADLFAGWFGSQILVSELSAAVVPSSVETPSAGPTLSPTDGSSPSASSSASAGTGGTPEASELPSGPTATSYLFDPSTGEALRIDRPMLLPAADPTRTFLVYWSGPIVQDPVSGQLEVGQGNLYLDSWANLKLVPASLDGITPVASPTPTTSAGQEPSVSPTPEATASPTTPSLTPGPVESSTDATATLQPSPTPVLPEVLRASPPNTVQDWVVDWDPTGQHIAVWVADPGSQSVGVVNLFAVDRGSGLVVTDGPLFHARGLPSVQFDNGRLVYTTPAEGSDGKTYLVPLPPTPPLPSPSPSPSASASQSPSSSTTDTPSPTAPPTGGAGS